MAESCPAPTERARKNLIHLLDGPLFSARLELEASIAGASLCECGKKAVCTLAHKALHFSRKLFFDKVAKQKGGCWLWIGSKDGQGYGRCRVGKNVMGAHRVAYLITKGTIQPGLELDHLCRNPACVNPDHLEPVSHSENMRRGLHASRTHCVNGHPRTIPNTYFDNRGWRYCRVCTQSRRHQRRQNTPGAECR